MAKGYLAKITTQGLETSVPEGQWKHTETGVNPVSATTVAYSDMPEYLWTGLVPGWHRFTGVRVSADKTQEIGDTYTRDVEITADVIVQVAAGLEVVVVTLEPTR